MFNITSSRRLKCFIAAAGIFVSFFIFGYFQEAVTRGHYVDEAGKKEKFSFFLLLVGVQCVWYTIFSKGESTDPPPPPLIPALLGPRI